MNPRIAGWTIFAAAIGAMCALLAVDIAKLQHWEQITQPAFVSSVLGHLATVISAFIGGKLIPESRNPEKRTRAEDSSFGNR